MPLAQSKSDYPNGQCAVITSLKVFATQWKPCILCFLADQPLRYNALYRAIPNISRKMLSQHLHEMDLDGLLTRVSYDAKRQRVEYGLTGKGFSLLPLMEQLQDWGLKYAGGVGSIREMLDAIHASDIRLQHIQEEKILSQQDLGKTNLLLFSLELDGANAAHRIVFVEIQFP